MATLIPALGSCVARKRTRGGTAIGCGRDGTTAQLRPLIVRLPTLREEVAQVAELLATAHREGHAWADMAILCRHHSEMDMCAEFLRKRKLPHQLRRNSSSVFDPAYDSSKVMTLHVSKGLEFPVVALIGAWRKPAEGEDESEEARRLVIGLSGSGRFGQRLAA
jgi:ATP-dependent exoDNAse (exonuclease V) beta subunit